MFFLCKIHVTAIRCSSKSSYSLHWLLLLIVSFPVQNPLLGFPLALPPIVIDSIQINSAIRFE
ncbi:hypothetical protein ACUUHL_002636, partial [Listeria monocytogenes]